MSPVNSGKGALRDLAGTHFDEESESTPRATLDDFSRWLEVMGMLGGAVHKHVDVEITADVKISAGAE